MWAINLVCSDDECGQEVEVLVSDLDEIDWYVCECGCCLVTLSVAEAVELRLPR